MRGMARKRFVSSDISIDKKIATLAEDNPTAALMWPWFTTAFDDWGRMGADPMEVKLTLFPAFPFTSKDIEEAILLFDERGLAHLYEVDGKLFLAVNPNTWFKYQTYISAKRKIEDGSKLPPPPNPPWKQNIIAENQQESAINQNKGIDNTKSDEEIAENLQTSQKIVPSLSLSPSLSEKKEEAEEEANPVNFFEQNGFGTISPLIADDIDQWQDKFNEPDLIIIEAMKQAVLKNAKHWNYVSKCLINWHDQKLRTLSDVKAYIKAFDERKNQRGSPRSRGRKEKLPEWIAEQQEQENQSVGSQGDEALEQKQGRIQELLRELKGGSP